MDINIPAQSTARASALDRSDLGTGSDARAVLAVCFMLVSLIRPIRKRP
jgi:hypothetical protein